MSRELPLQRFFFYQGRLDDNHRHLGRPMMPPQKKQKDFADTLAELIYD